MKKRSAIRQEKFYQCRSLFSAATTERSSFLLLCRIVSNAAADKRSWLVEPCSGDVEAIIFRRSFPMTYDPSTDRIAVLESGFLRSPSPPQPTHLPICTPVITAELLHSRQAPLIYNALTSPVLFSQCNLSRLQLKKDSG